jgi:aminocarboxymuconate-semialdehyde decarboxylase
MYGSDHVLVGTDCPFDMGEKDPLGFLDQVHGLSADDVDAVSGGNAAGLLGIDEKEWLARFGRRRATGEVASS